MTDRDEHLEAVQDVVERLGARWKAGTEAVDDDLAHALAAAGLQVMEADLHSLASAIEASHGTVTVSSVLPR